METHAIVFVVVKIKGIYPHLGYTGINQGGFHRSQQSDITLKAMWDQSCCFNMDKGHISMNTILKIVRGKLGSFSRKIAVVSVKVIISQVSADHKY